MSFIVQQEVTSRLGARHWVRVAGPYGSVAEAEAAIKRRAQLIDAPMRGCSIGTMA